MLSKLFHGKPNFRLQWTILMPVVILCTVGLLILSSTSKGSPFFESSVFKQMVWMAVGLTAIAGLQFIRIQFFYEYAYLFYGLLILALIGTYFGPVISGARRWLPLGPVSIQPSEMGKLVIIFAVAKFLSERHENSNQRITLLVTMIMALFPALLVFRQPDLGTAFIYVAVVLPMLYWNGIRPYFLFVMIAPLISIMAAFHLISFYIWIIILICVLFLSQPRLWVGVGFALLNVAFGTLSSFIWNHLYPHQKMRILTFLDPMKDPQGAGYQIIQSITAIGSGGLIGKGLGEGTQTHLRFLPVMDTDFVISVLGEELGFAGIMVVLICFLVLIYWMVSYAEYIHNKFAGLVIVGFSALLLVHLTINMAMAAGVFPVTGLPAPFISYGGSFLLTALTTIGLANNIVTHNI